MPHQNNQWFQDIALDSGRKLGYDNARQYEESKIFSTSLTKNLLFRMLSFKDPYLCRICAVCACCSDDAILDRISRAAFDRS
jgi:hypothetical protein